ncbi:putative exodeoxyribonuclease V [Neisseria zoodegmatis]|uniref:RecBCD enzyme subunit RecC n=1 Tax=Neisseria zoodegmatis TaxID=326523 RepID=A0A378WS62_9NEIS|nr:exodeoxyribonuclease V subunit gamma [Neisseria zoodegmatis]SUA44200.1 putative exodeoxyribonuclease V [Neisseria zoodegmatis]
MLYLYQSNRLEDLAALFAQVHRLQPPENPFEPEEIVVQSQGMRRYLNTYLARETGVAANLNFSLPAGLAWQLMRRFIPGIPALSPFFPEVMRWRLLDLFQSQDFQTASEYLPAREALQSYLDSGSTAAYQLAGQLADIFDQYLVYRPQWIDAWQQGKTVGLGGDEAWQAVLWRYLDDGSQHTPHRVGLWRQLLDSLDPQHLPRRYCVFGIATMAPMYLQLLQALAEHCDVHIFALNPSSGYWGNVIEAAQILQQEDDADLSLSGHPLLASLGKQGRDFFDALTDIPKHEISVFDEEPFQTAPPTLLRRLQYDIQTLSMPSENPHGLPQPDLNDGSIQAVSAHSPLRELQILKDRLLEVLAEHPDWQPHDIAVLTPHIEPYSPFIEAVFGQEQTGSHALPYSVSDVKISRRQPLFQALAQALTLLESRFEVNLLLPLLENDLVLQRFELTRDDLPLLHDTISALNVHWGTDEHMRGGRNNLFTWQQGLERLALGWMLPESRHPLWKRISAWHGNPNHTAVLSRFSALVRTLTDTARLWAKPAPVAEWTERIRRLTSALAATDADGQYAWQQLTQALARWQEEAELAGFSGTLPRQTVIRHIGRFLDSESQAGFLRGGITFCSMVPMRSLPFKMICLLGLNDGDFPRNTKAAAFDLIARHPQKGDRARRDDDRYLFLEAVMSARDILYLSYIGRDIRNDQPLAPSALLGELIDTLAAMTGRAAQELHAHWVKQHPLQPFSHRYFTPESAGSDGLTSTRLDYAEALNRPPEPEAPFFTEPLDDAAATDNTVAHHSFIRFWKNPVRTWLQHTLHWQKPYRDAAWEAAEPFEPQQSARITAEYTAARRHNEDFGRLESRLQAESLLPAGELGALWQNRFQTAAKSLDHTLVTSPKLPPAPYTLTVGAYTLEGSLNHLYRHGQIYFPCQAFKAPEQLAVLLEHLIFCAVRPSETGQYQTHILLPEQPQTLAEIPQQEAVEALQNWLEYYQIGQTRPLPFFPRVNYKAAQEWNKSNDQSKALNEAYKLYHGGTHSAGQKSYPEVALVFGGNEEDPTASTLFWNITADLLAPLIRLTTPPADND